MARSLERLYPYQFSVLPVRGLARMPHGGFYYLTREASLSNLEYQSRRQRPPVHFPTAMSSVVCNSNFCALIFALVGHKNPAVPLPTRLFHPDYVCCAVLCRVVWQPCRGSLWSPRSARPRTPGVAWASPNRCRPRPSKSCGASAGAATSPT